MDRIIKYRIIIIALTFILLGAGMFIGYEYTKKSVSKTEENPALVVDNKVEDSTDVKIYEDVSTKTYDIEVIYEDKYKLCGHTITTSNTFYGTTVDKVKEDEIKKQKQEDKEYIVEVEECDKIVFSRTVERKLSKSL